MTKARLDALILLVAGSAIFVALGIGFERVTVVSMVDFKCVYYAGRTLLAHADPYNATDSLYIYDADLANHPSDPAPIRTVVTRYIYLPTAFLLTAPFAALPWGPAHLLWMLATASSFILAAFLVWNLADKDAPRVAALLICLFLVGSEMLIEIGNPAGIAIALCAIGVWCIVKERFLLAGMICFAVSLAVKPHDTGPIWLCLLLAGGAYRKRALQTALLTVALCLPVVLWVNSAAPHWLAELRWNLAADAAPGGFNDPGPATLAVRDHAASVIGLQTVLSVFRDDPRFYDLTTDLICAPLLILWIIATLRSRGSPALLRLALASISALSMLALYHRQHDTRILLLTVPACAMLWAEGGAIRWIAVAINGAGALLTGDIPLQLLAIFAGSLHLSLTTLSGKLLTILLARPAPLVMLAMAVFYLWLLVQRSFRPRGSGVPAIQATETSLQAERAG